MTIQLHPSSRTAPVGHERVPVGSVQGTLALSYPAELEHSKGTPALRLMTGGRMELESFARRFASVVVEVVGGDRGPSQLLRWTSQGVYAELQRRVTLLQRTVPSDRRLRRLRSQVRSVHVFCPSSSAAEVSVHVRQGARSRALAFRLDMIEGRWICTALQFG